MQPKVLLLIGGLLVAAGVTTLALRHFHEGHAGSGSHEHHGGGTTAMTLDDGKKWVPDAPLRTGMERVRRAVQGASATAGGKAAPDAVDTQAADEIRASVQDIIANCKLTPAADATLHVILADVLAGEAILRGSAPGAPAEGYQRITKAMELYPTYFEHPGWTP